MGRRWRRFVALGDSTTEGLMDPDGAGGWRGWADRIAERLAESQDGIAYANLAVRGRRAGRIRAEQLPVALALNPDLASVLAGMNDLIGPRFRLAEVAGEVDAMLEALTGAGATALVFTIPYPGRANPLTVPIRPRFVALNESIRASARRTGAVLVDLARHQVGRDPRLWSEDRLHGSPEGHRRIAEGAAQALGLPGSDAAWTDPMPLAARRPVAEVAAAELDWHRRHFLPWLAAGIRGRSVAENPGPKRPALSPVVAGTGTGSSA